MTEYRWYRVQVEQSIPATQVLRRVIEVEVKVPSKLEAKAQYYDDDPTEDKLALLACDVAEKQARLMIADGDLDFKETIDPECDEEMIENKPEYYVHEGTTRPNIVAVDSIGVV